MTEKSLTNSIKAALKREGWWVLKIHGGGMQIPGLPDLLCCKDGIAVWLEVKVPGGKPTKLQVARMEEIRKQGGCTVAVVTSVAEALLIASNFS